MDWEAEGEQIARFIKRNKIPFRLIGGDLTQAQVQLRVPTEYVSAAGWVPSVEDYWKTVDYDIGVIPLKPHLFNQSKSHLKFLENAALGIPTVASDTGPYTRAIKHGETGFLVKRDHEWGKYLRDLVNDEDMRLEMGRNAKEWAKTQILEDHLDEWAKVFFE
jgi:glycosyltransferase involved in cell wall biosynthesis